MPIHIVLTHEQADFDALASLLGAHLLSDEKIAVLPRRMNRNVRAFLTLYGLDLPFVEQRDLDGAPIETVTLVDTQGMVSVKGMNSRTRVHVIDHHPRRESVPADWSVHIDEIGATTTLLIEALRDADIPLSTIQATLLLLGIYEDTGSLTYARTTARDLKAAAFLLEQGASLRTASSYLNHPLSQAQQALYDRLRATAEHLHIHGHTVILACGEALDTDEELSSITHKLRDLLDPDGLFVLVSTKSGVQMIARSTSDHIDVAEILGVFGGGGHDRAAAGLIRERPQEDVRAELLRILPDHVRPAITVAQIMSRSPQLLYKDTPVEEAAQRMRRFGYEGYPVVERTTRAPGHNPAPAQRVVGLLTRRAVDRALSHNLHLPASRLMDAGEVTIKPDDSLEELQRLMTETGWGQIPVIHPQSGEIIGIVTRTDLLKTLNDLSRAPVRLDLAPRLEASLPAAHLALLQVAAQAASEQHMALYIVGGFVRDLLLERPSEDLDLVVEGDAIALARALAAQFGGRVTAHARFGTAKWRLDGVGPALTRALENARPPAENTSGQALEGLPGAIDLISARTEFYTHPTALPTVERGSIKLDLHRRDFTINTLALRLDGRHYGELHDYWGGLTDLRHRTVRVLHSLSFVDDPTRILRAVRFEQRFEFRIDERTLDLLKEAAPLLARVSGDRLRHELDHILVEKRLPQILARLDGLGLLAAIHPDLTWDEWLESRLEGLAIKAPDPAWGLKPGESGPPLQRDVAYTLWLLRLPPAQAEDVAARLKLPKELCQVIRSAGQLWTALPDLVGASPSQAVRQLEDTPPVARYAVYRATSDIGLRRTLLLYAAQWQHIQPTISGDDLRRLGLRPGPRYRDILFAVRAAWLDGGIHNADEERLLLDELVRQARQEPEAEFQGKEDEAGGPGPGERG